MTVRLYEWDKTETGWAWIEITDNKVVNLILRELNNLIKINSNNEVYTDLQLDDNLLSSAVLPVGVTTGRVLQANWRPVTWTLISAKTTSGDNIKILYGDDGEIRVDNGTGVWKIIWLWEITTYGNATNPNVYYGIGFQGLLPYEYLSWFYTAQEMVDELNTNPSAYYLRYTETNHILVNSGKSYLSYSGWDKTSFSWWPYIIYDEWTWETYDPWIN